MSDTPLAPQTYPPPSRLDQIKGFIGDLARPFAIICTTIAASVSTVIVALKVDSFEGAATFIGAVYLGLGGLYGAKSWEVARTGKQAAEVAIAQATPPTAAG